MKRLNLSFFILLKVKIVLITLFFVTNVSAQTLTVDTYSTVGTFDWVVPACVTSVTVRAWGGGGAGGGASATDRNGGGGGGGAYCIKTETVIPGETLRITVGGGGVGVSANTGGAGGFSQVQHLTGPVIFCKAAGGSGGQRGSSSASAGAGGAGGAIANNIPVGTGFRGGNGGSSNPNTTIDESGGGGGGAGSGSNGGDGAIITAGTAGSPAGGAGGNGIGTTISTGGNGSPGIALGGGGGGSTVFSSSTPRAGATGAQGQITITYTATGCEPAATMFAYTIVGTYNWIVPICVNFVTVEAFGGGGGGGGNIAVISGGQETCTGAGGGGGGGYAARTYAVVPGQSYTIVVGDGGTAGAAGVGTTGGITTPAGNGGAGQPSTFSGPATLGPGTLTGTGGGGGSGAGGRNTTASTCLAVSAANGAGNIGLNGTINYRGGNGAPGLIANFGTDRSGGAGGGAGPGGNGSNAPSAGSVGTGTNPPGGIGNPSGGNGGNGRVYNTLGTATLNGGNGNIIGGGGGGSLIHINTFGVATAVGGVGARGEVRLSYNTSCPMPIELISFNGNCSEREKSFNWSTATEHINDYFMLEHSRDGQNFEVIKIVDGAGNSTTRIDYSLVISEEDESNLYYRLGQTDFDGAQTYSDIVHVSCLQNSTSGNIFVYPNPTSKILTIDVVLANSGDLTYQIKNLVDKVVMTIHQNQTEKGSKTIDVSSLEVGNYVIEVTDKINGERIGVATFTRSN